MARSCYVTSDLHLGNGVPGDPLEDFWQDAAFAAWVGALPGAGTTLVLNGDVIECTQLAPFAAAGVPRHLAWDEEASLRKVGAAVAGHPAFFDALADLVDRGGQVVFVIGNHDLDLDFPRVQRLLGDRLGAPGGDRVRFTVGPLRYGGVHIVHGHQWTPENCPQDPRRFRHRHDDGGGEREFLERVWGTDFVLHVFNDLEERFPFADNVKPTYQVALRGFREGWLGGREVARLVSFLVHRHLPWSVVRSMVADERPLGPGPPVLGGRERRGAREALASADFVVAGHTHTIVDGALGGRAFNPGTWIPRLHLESPDVREHVAREGCTPAVLSDPDLYDVTLRAVRIRPDAGHRGTVDLVPIDPDTSVPVHGARPIDRTVTADDVSRDAPTGS